MESLAAEKAKLAKLCIQIIFQRVEKVFSPRCADFETFKKVSKSCLIERAVGFLPPAHTPRCSVASVFCGVFLQPEFFLPAFPLHLIDNRPQGSKIDKICLLAVGFH